METIIYPRSPRESMTGWVHLPRFIDKIRLHLAGRLHPDYQQNFLVKGFDRAWLDAAGVRAEDFIEVVRNSLTDGEVADWVLKNAAKTREAKEAFREFVLGHGQETDELKARLKWRKEEAGLAERDDIENFVDFIDADEKRI